jgi:segregation and condensation protein A
MDTAKIFEGIALLIELAKKGEIDPWDVQVIEVIDRYLSELISAQKITPGSCEADLSQSGQAFLLASLLVLFKANTLSELESPADEEPSADDLLWEGEDEAGTPLRLPLERQLSRRPAALPPQKRQVTLKELIDQLQLIATQLQLSQATLSTKTPRNRRLGTVSGTDTAAGSPLELAHQENLTEVAGELEQFFNRHSHQLLAQEHDWLDLEELVKLWIHTKQAALLTASNQYGKQAHPQFDCSLPPQRHERVSIFWALLLLSAQSKVELCQEEFYQEIKIRALFDSQYSAIAIPEAKAVCSY